MSKAPQLQTTMQSLATDPFCFAQLLVPSKIFTQSVLGAVCHSYLISVILLPGAAAPGVQEPSLMRKEQSVQSPYLFITSPKPCSKCPPSKDWLGQVSKCQVLSY